MGLRIDLTGPQYNSRGQLSSFDPTLWKGE